MTWKLDKPYSGYNVGQLLGLIQADKEGLTNEEKRKRNLAMGISALLGGVDTRARAKQTKVVNTLNQSKTTDIAKSSKMYDDAILLSGRKYWYRQEGRLYLYNEHYNSNIAAYSDGVDADIYKTNIAVWMLAKSDTLSMHDEFPIPSDAISETIKSLVATFGMMRAAKEDNINNNVDNT